MEQTNYNRKVRNELCKTIDTLMQKTGLPLEICIDIYMELYYIPIDKNDKIRIVQRAFLNSVLFVDTFKMLVYKQKENMCSDEELIYFNMLVNTKDFSDAITDFSSDIGYLRKCITATYEFHKLPGFAKVNIVKSLSEQENDWLLSLFEVHQFDLDTYGRNINLSDVKKNMKNQYNHQKNMNGDVCLDSIAVSVLGFVKNLFKNDEENAYTLLLEIGKEDYEINKYINSKKEDDDTIDHVDLYENYSQEQIVEHLRYNEAYLVDAIWAILEANLLNKYKDVEIENYGMNDSDPNIKKFLLK